MDTRRTERFFADQTCIVTGGTSGVGRALVRSLAASGARVGVIARGREAMNATLGELRERGAKAHGVIADVADAAAVFRAAEEFEATLGPLDVWFNNAMTTVFSWITDLHPDELRRATDVTYHGAVWGTMAALKHMRLRNRGAIVQIGSALSYRAIPMQAAYCASKHAMRGFTDSLRSELIARQDNIQLTMVHLPAVNTPQFLHCKSKLDVQPQPVPPIYQPEPIAAAILDATMRGRREALVGFSTVKAVFGSQLAPGFVDHYLAWTGIDSQKTQTPVNGKSNLFEPVEADLGARGPFGDNARQGGLALRAITRAGGGGLRAAVLGIGLLGLLAVTAAALTSTRNLGYRLR